MLNKNERTPDQEQKHPNTNHSQSSIIIRGLSRRRLLQIGILLGIAGSATIGAFIFSKKHQEELKDFELPHIEFREISLLEETFEEFDALSLEETQEIGAVLLDYLQHTFKMGENLLKIFSQFIEKYPQFSKIFGVPKNEIEVAKVFNRFLLTKRYYLLGGKSSKNPAAMIFALFSADVQTEAIVTWQNITVRIPIVRFLEQLPFSASAWYDHFENLILHHEKMDVFIAQNATRITASHRNNPPNNIEIALSQSTLIHEATHALQYELFPKTMHAKDKNGEKQFFVPSEILANLPGNMKQYLQHEKLTLAQLSEVAAMGAGFALAPDDITLIISAALSSPASHASHSVHRLGKFLYLWFLLDEQTISSNSLEKLRLELQDGSPQKETVLQALHDPLISVDILKKTAQRLYRLGMQMLQFLETNYQL